MSGPKRDHQLVLYGPDRKHGATPKKGFKRYPWYIVWYEGGRKREHATGETDFKAAEEYLYNVWLPSRLIKPTGPLEPNEMSISVALSLYGDEHGEHTSDPARIGYAIDALAPYWEGKSCDQVTAITSRQYTRHRLDQGRAESTARRELGILQAALNYCRDQGYLSRAPKVTLPEKAEPKDRWLNSSEIAALLRAAKSETKARFRTPLFIQIALYTAARTNAILKLQWQENVFGGWIDLDNKIIYWKPRGHKDTNKRRPKGTPIHHRLLRFLRYQRRRTRTWVFETNGKWAGNNKTAFNTATRNAWLTKDMEGNPIKGVLEDVTRHDLKHTSITWMMQKGVHDWEVSGYTGTSVETIRRVYAHHAPDYMQQALKAFD